MKTFGKAEYPFVCVPLRHKNKAIGIIGIDTFNGVPKTPAIPHPEPELLSFLETVGKLIIYHSQYTFINLYTFVYMYIFIYVCIYIYSFD